MPIPTARRGGSRPADGGGGKQRAGVRRRSEARPPRPPLKCGAAQARGGRARLVLRGQRLALRLRRRRVGVSGVPVAQRVRSVRRVARRGLRAPAAGAGPADVGGGGGEVVEAGDSEVEVLCRCGARSSEPQLMIRRRSVGSGARSALRRTTRGRSQPVDHGGQRFFFIAIARQPARTAAAFCSSTHLPQPGLPVSSPGGG